ncbi:hypothetical protein FXO38_19673 [Capsicum annuum]|nr:hypothetical protein FXO38_19673 [Capsicum annuum]
MGGVGRELGWGGGPGRDVWVRRGWTGAGALKALVLERMGKAEEAFSVCLSAKELLYTNDSVLIDDLTLSTLQIVFQRLDHLDMATSCYEYACGKFPNNLDLMMGLFNCYVREYSFVKQQQIAIKMYKIVGEERFLLWAVCSIQLQTMDAALMSRKCVDASKGRTYQGYQCSSDSFEVVSGLAVNWKKNSNLPTKDVAQVKRLAYILGCRMEKLPTVYLGIRLNKLSKVCGPERNQGLGWNGGTLLLGVLRQYRSAKRLGLERLGFLFTCGREKFSNRSEILVVAGKQTEEETELKNHLKWARIEVLGDGRNIPSKVTLVKEGLKFLIPIWVERKPIERISNDLPATGDGEPRGIRGPTISNFKTHVGSCKEKGFALVDMSHPLGHFDSNKKIGLDPAQIIYNNIMEKPNCDKRDLLLFEQSMTNTSTSQQCSILLKYYSCQHQMAVGGRQIVPREKEGGENYDDGEGNSQGVEDVTPLQTEQNYTLMEKELETTVWVKQNFLKLSKMFGIDYKGHEKETFELLMQIDGSSQAMRMEHATKIKKTRSKESRGREILRMINEAKTNYMECEGIKRSGEEKTDQKPIVGWKANLVCLQETKSEGDCRDLIKHIGGGKWTRFACLEASGARGGIIMLWDSRVWKGQVLQIGAYSLTCRCSKWRTSVMVEFSDFIEDMELLDPQLEDSSFTWFKGDCQEAASRIDIFLFSSEWDRSFNNIKQVSLQRLVSDHVPIALHYGT